MKLTVKVGNAELEFEGRDYKDVIKDAGAFTQAQKCKLCKSGNIALNYKNVQAKEGENAGKNFEYYEVVCLDCGAKATLGLYQNGGYFLKQWEKQTYGAK